MLFRSKQRGGLVTEWIGLTTDYGSYSLGLSERRAGWLVDWIGRVCQRKLVWPGEFASCLGRLGFAATALPWEKPFLGPLYTWAAAVREQKGEVHSGLDLPEVEGGWPDGDGGRGGPVGSGGSNLLY